MVSELFLLVLIKEVAIVITFIVKQFSNRLDYTEQLIAKDQITEIKRLEYNN